jgi:hypothetical protein
VREATIWQAQAESAGSKRVKIAKELTGLESGISSMNGEITNLKKAEKIDRVNAITAAVHQYVTGAVARVPSLFPSLLSSDTDADIYRSIAVATQTAAIAKYVAVQARIRSDEAIASARLEVIDNNLHSVFLNPRGLQRKANWAIGQLTSLGVGGVSARVLGDANALSIDGPSALSASELAAWWNSQGYVNNTGVGILALAKEYIKAGRAEGISGDVAFAQSVLETGGFEAMSGDNNFAGIGACNSCDGGYNYPSYIQGIRAQVQLLKAYTDKNLTSKQLVGGVAYQGVNTLSVRGCCTTWTGLSTVWSTGTHYGDVILGIYTDILGYTINHIKVSRVVTRPPRSPRGTLGVNLLRQTLSGL